MCTLVIGQYQIILYPIKIKQGKEKRFTLEVATVLSSSFNDDQPILRFMAVDREMSQRIAS